MRRFVGAAVSNSGPCGIRHIENLQCSSLTATLTSPSYFKGWEWNETVYPVCLFLASKSIRAIIFWFESNLTGTCLWLSSGELTGGCLARDSYRVLPLVTISLERCGEWLGEFTSKWASCASDCKPRTFYISLERCSFWRGDVMPDWTGCDAGSECLPFRAPLEPCCAEYMLSLYLLWLTWVVRCLLVTWEDLFFRSFIPVWKVKLLRMSLPRFKGSKELRGATHIASVVMEYRLRNCNVTTLGRAHYRVFIFKLWREMLSIIQIIQTVGICFNNLNVMDSYVQLFPLKDLCRKSSRMFSLKSSGSTFWISTCLLFHYQMSEPSNPSIFPLLMVGKVLKSTTISIFHSRLGHQLALSLMLSNTQFRTIFIESIAVQLICN